ncbi:MAG TPA: cytochrome c maturation protein CcmE [Cellvibrionaceae bacterium]|nr:cytochrome c maturation protein CcmE [Cellvibrionaceae bacterium]HMW72537.1 cytochrome c maturation protein CcmE [Cellvibrionaceae bacterium]HMY38967.1 cytochrome c maturation protein CcmE [Marinagarivorans sp.]HNG61232.1 cytochrome c maturation protein CcmE [Cellvibrionaceae bacterium]
MHPLRKQRLVLVSAIVVVSSIIAILVGFAMKEYANLFYPVSKVASGEAPRGKSIRAGGCVVPGSVKKSKEMLLTTFDLTDGQASITVTYDSILPDLFAEGEAAVVTGVVGGDGIMKASEVLAKHDENYTPPEVAESVKNTSKHQQACKGMEYDT